MFQTKYDWQYYTENDGRASQGIQNGRVFWPRGKMLGGSSGINNMLYFKGSHCDYRSWYNEGNKEWRPDIVSKYFKKAESLQNVELLRDKQTNKEYGHNGPLTINSFNSTYRNITLRVLDAYNEIGFNYVRDLNAADLLGSGLMRGTAANGRRMDTASAYLTPVKGRSNLFVIKQSFVHKVLINKVNNVAHGVEVTRNGKQQYFYANKEVIICAGAINTPQILMLSGIGPQNHLKSHDIEVIADLSEVGQNLLDHFIVPVHVYADMPGLQNMAETYLGVIQYLHNQTGFLAQNSISDVAAFYSLDKDASFPDFQVHLSIHNKQSAGIRKYLESIVGFKQEAQDSIVKQNQDAALYIFLFNLLHPYSKGNITLRSSNPRDYPLIYANYFADERDINKTAAGLKMLTKIVGSQFYRSIGGRVGRVDFGPCNQFEFDCSEYWKCIAINFVTSMYHPTGTARMGVSPSTSVVDSRLRVHGVHKLRIIDASVMPSQVSSNTNGPVIMIGERGADLVKEDHGVI